MCRRVSHFMDYLSLMQTRLIKKNFFCTAVDDAFIQTVKQVFGGDGDKKNLVDPYLEVSFAGKKVFRLGNLLLSSLLSATFAYTS